MADSTTKIYLDYAGLKEYDKLIKQHISTEDAKSYKTIIRDGDTIKFYKSESPAEGAQPDYSLTISSTDVSNLKTRVGMDSTLNAYQTKTNVTDIVNVLTSADTVDGSVAKVAKEAAATAIDALGGSATHVAGADGLSLSVTSENGEVKSITGSIAANTYDTYGAAAAVLGDEDDTAADNTVYGAKAAAAAVAADLAALDLADVAETGKFVTQVTQEDGQITVTRAALIASDIPDLTLAKITDAGTAAAANVATAAIAEDSEDASLVSAAQVATFVKNEVADLSGAMHFVGAATPAEGETDVEAIAKLYAEGKSPKAGDFAIITTNGLEYVYNGTAWVKLGDELTYVTKSTTIAGVDLEDNITKTELLTALNVADGAEVNVIESVDTADFSIDSDKKLSLAANLKLTTSDQVTKLDNIEVKVTSSETSVTDGTNTLSFSAIPKTGEGDSIAALFTTTEE